MPANSLIERPITAIKYHMRVALINFNDIEVTIFSYVVSYSGSSG